MLRTLLASLLFSFATLCFSQTQTLPKEFAEWIKSKGMTHATVSLEIARITSPDKEPSAIYSYDAERSVQPASVMKLLTTSAALGVLNPEQTIPTEVYLEQTLDSASQSRLGVFEGNLIIKGYGNAMLASSKSRFPKDAFVNGLVSALKDLGIKEISGDIIGDGSAFTQSPVSSEWTWEDMGNHYAPAISGLNYGDNSYDIVLNTSKVGEKPSVVKIEPMVDGLVIDNQLSAKNYSFDSAYVYGAPYQKTRTLLGAVPHRQPQFRVKGDVPDPAQFAASRVKAALQKAGIKVNGSAKNITYPNPLPLTFTPIYEFSSEPISFIAKQTNVYSVNLFAEMLLRQLGLNIENEGSETAGIRVVYRFLNNLGLDTDGIRIFDGCGLAPADRVTAHFMVGLLNKMQKNQNFVNSLPVAGQTGTVHSFLKDTRLSGKARLKTGTTKAVIAYTGYVTGSDGQLYAVSFIVNNHTCKALTVRKNIEKMLLLLIP